MKKRNLFILVLILLMTIGFASMSTNLVLNGLVSFGISGDFDVIFTDAIINGQNKKGYISEDQHKVSFITNELKTIEDKLILDYELTNTSRNYDAKVKVVCSSDNDYVMFSYEPTELNILAGKTEGVTVTTSLIKAIEKDSQITCEIVAVAIERDTLGDEYVAPFSKSGVLKSTSSSNTSEFWGYRSNITKVIFEDEMITHETDENLIFDVSDMQNRSVIAYLVANGESLTTNKDANNKALTSTTAYTLYIQSDTGVKSNEYSYYLFHKFNNLIEIDNMKYFDTSNAINMNHMFSYCSNLGALDLSRFDTSDVLKMVSMFYKCTNLTTLDVSNFDTNNVKDMSSMFSECTKLKTLDVANFNTGNVTFMNELFYKCTNLTTLDVSNFDTSNVTDMSWMFYECSSLKLLEISNFDTSKVKNMSYMFYRCWNLTSLDVSGFDTSNVTNMSGMFSRCEGLVFLDVSNFNTSNATSMSAMFEVCVGLTSLDLSNFDTSKVTSMSGMFYYCTSLTFLDISNFDTSKVTIMSNMFLSMPTNAKVMVKDKATQDFVLALTSANRPASWTTDNVIIAS